MRIGDSVFLELIAGCRVPTWFEIVKGTEGSVANKVEGRGDSQPQPVALARFALALVMEIFVPPSTLLFLRTLAADLLLAWPLTAGWPVLAALCSSSRSVNRPASSISSFVRDLDTPRTFAVRYGVAKGLSTLIAWVIWVHYNAWVGAPLVARFAMNGNLDLTWCLAVQGLCRFGPCRAARLSTSQHYPLARSQQKPELEYRQRLPVFERREKLRSRQHYTTRSRWKRLPFPMALKTAKTESPNSNADSQYSFFFPLSRNLATSSASDASVLVRNRW